MFCFVLFVCCFWKSKLQHYLFAIFSLNASTSNALRRLARRNSTLLAVYEKTCSSYSRFSRDVTAAMLVYRTISKKVFWEFSAIFMQNLSDILPLFCTPTCPSHHVSENQELKRTPIYLKFFFIIKEVSQDSNTHKYYKYEYSNLNNY